MCQTQRTGHAPWLDNGRRKAHKWLVSYESLSKSIADLWYENIGYRFLVLALSLYSVLFKSTLNNANMKHGWPQTSIHLYIAGNGFRAAPSLILQPCWGNIQANSTVVESLILWKRKKGHLPLCKTMASESATLPRSKALETEDGTS